MREEELTQVRERIDVRDYISVVGFTASIGSYSIFKEVVGSSPLWFPRGKSLCLLSLVIDCCACYSLI